MSFKNIVDDVSMILSVPDEKSSSVNVRLTELDKDLLTKIASDYHGTTISNLIRAILSAYIQEFANSHEDISKFMAEAIQNRRKKK